MGVGISDEQVCLHLSPAVHCPISGGQEGRTSRGQLLQFIMNYSFFQILLKFFYKMLMVI